MAKILDSAWKIIGEPSNKNSQVALAIVVILASTIFIGFVAFFYGFSVRWALGCECTSFCVISGGLLAILYGAAAFAAGGLLGLLFGAPNLGDAAKQFANNSEKQNEKSPANSGTSSDSFGIRPNTSLERIAEWLTTMIVGVSLVHLQTIGEHATYLGIYLSKEISLNSAASNPAPGLSLVIAFCLAGFFLVYLWSMRFLPSELRESYSGLAQKIKDVVSKTDIIDDKFKELPLFPVPEDKLTQLLTRLAEAGVDADTCENIRTRYQGASKASDEPMRDFGPSKLNGSFISAQVKEAVSGTGALYSFKAILTKDQSNIATKMFWLLHNTYAPEVISECEFNGDIAEYSSTAYEGFWIGAVIPVKGGKATKLSFDLGNAEGAPPGFAAPSGHK